MSELKRCPFCGGEAEILASNGLTKGWITCSHCGAEVPIIQTKKEAVAAWNRRADGWISVDERLPDGEVDVLVRPVVGPPCTAWLQADGRWNMSLPFDMDYYLDVTHWMPLP